MAEDNQINLDSLLASKQYNVKNRKDREKKDKLVKTVLDFGERFMSSFLIDQPAALKKETIQANLEDNRFQSAVKREELKHKYSYLNDRKKDLDFVNSFSSQDEGFKKLAEKNWLTTEEGKKYTQLGADDAYLNFPTSINKKILEAKDNYLKTEGTRIKNLYMPFINDPNLIVNLAAEPEKLSRELRNKLYAETYAKAEAEYGTFNFIKGLFGENVAAHSRYAYLADEAEQKINERSAEISNLANFNTFADRTKLDKTMLNTPFDLGESYKSRFKKINQALKNTDSASGKSAVKTLGLVLPEKILVMEAKELEEGNIISGADLSSEQREILRNANQTNQIKQNIFLESSTTGNFYGISEGTEFRKRSDSELGLNPKLKPTQQVVIRRKNTDKNGNASYVEQNISLNEALISDIALGSEFFRHKDLLAGGEMLTQQEDVGFNYERKYMELLMESGNLWYDQNGVLYYDRPALARDLSQANNLMKGFNEVDAIYARYEKQLDSESISTADFFNQSIVSKINSIRNSNISSADIENKVSELNNLNNEKDKQQEFLINLVMPTDELKGSIVKYANSYLTAGELTSEEKIKLYNNFVEKYNDGEDNPLLKTIFKI